ncbi:MAG: tRNA(His) guanylyltransferase Thg1 family protein [Vulcanisaeta sp.]|jgi:hypothetical protein|uniref:tRNA(His) guanylyltransferase Thg1 family protein n=1 Tax=Vulcanisaeta sp. TaxID=2020871 RepID=UPI003D1253B8
MSNIDVVNLLIGVNPVELEKDFDSRVVTSIIKPPIVVRLDGTGFGKALKDFTWPRDERVHRALIKAAMELIRAFSGEYALVISDEISVFLLNYVPFNGREYKLVSSMAGLASAVISNALGRVLYFDARVMQLNDSCLDVARYMLYRVRVGFNNYHVEIAQRSRVIPPESTPHINEVIKALGGPRLTWESLGTCLVRSRVELEGVDRRSGERVKYVRRRIIEKNPIDVINELSTCGLNLQ